MAGRIGCGVEAGKPLFLDTDNGDQGDRVGVAGFLPSCTFRYYEMATMTVTWWEEGDYWHARSHGRDQHDCISVLQNFIEENPESSTDAIEILRLRLRGILRYILGTHQLKRKVVFLVAARRDVLVFITTSVGLSPAVLALQEESPVLGQVCSLAAADLEPRPGCRLVIRHGLIGLVASSS